MSENKSVLKTLLMSIVMSSPGPLVLGLGLISGRSSTQIADFVRRSAELLAIIMSFAVYTVISNDTSLDEIKRKKIESNSNLFVGSMMLLAGTIMALIAITIKNSDKGNVVSGLVIAILSAVANSVFWIKYTHLNRTTHNAILAVQARLYRAKTLVDTSVTIALTAIIINAQSPISYWFDIIGSIVVALYLSWSGIKTIYKEIKES